MIRKTFDSNWIGRWFRYISSWYTLTIMLTFYIEYIMLTVENSYYFSLFIQLVSLLIFYSTTNLYIPSSRILLENAYRLEYLVSIIEFFGYLVLGYFLNTKTNLTAIRYGDWFITTNMLLISLSCFLLYNREKTHLTESEMSKYDFRYLKETYGKEFTQMMCFNTLMLMFGFAGELGYLNRYVSLGFGLIFFFLSFYIVYQNFVGDIFLNHAFLTLFIFIWLLC